MSIQTEVIQNQLQKLSDLLLKMENLERSLVSSSQSLDKSVDAYEKFETNLFETQME